MSRRVGIHDVAVAAGVSTTTVSHALSGRGKVSPDTRDRVRRIADDLGYAPNRIATALRRRRTDVIGFVSDEIATTPFAGRIVLGAQDAAAEAGMTLMVVNSNRDAEVERRQIEVLRAQQVDALIYATMFHRSVELPPAIDAMPVVLVNAVDLTDAPSVAPDEVGAACAATALLAKAGHGRITHLTIEDPGFATGGRLDGYTSTMLGLGLEPVVVAVPGAGDTDAGRRAFERSLTERPESTAVFCFNDQMAMGVYQVAAERRMRIPDDISVVGVDNLELIADSMRPGLTTLALPHYEMGQWAVREAVRRLDGDISRPEHLLLPCPVVERGSVGPIDASADRYRFVSTAPGRVPRTGG